MPKERVSRKVIQIDKIEQLRQSAFEENNYEYFLVFNSANLIYFTGFSGATALVIPKEGISTLYVSAVNYEQAKDETSNLTVERLKRGDSLLQKIAKNKLSKKKKFGFDSLPTEAWRTLGMLVGEEKLEANNELIRDLRKVKNPEEIQLIREACNLAEVGIKVASQIVKPGVKEREVAAEVEYAVRKGGSDALGMGAMISSGVNSAFPHGTCSDRIIEEGDLVVVHLGATRTFYHSDITRTFVAGKASEKQTKIYEAVKLSHQKAFEAIKPKAKTKDVDASARQVIEDAGYGEFFVHNVGHGVGLEAHEIPILSVENKEELQTGNVVTIEPGVYLPGYGGVRIEDTVLVTEKGSEKLTSGFYNLERDE